MNTTSEILLIICCIITIAMGIFIVQILLRKLRLKSESETKIKISYGIWIMSLFVAYCINTAKTIEILNEAYDTIMKVNQSDALSKILQTSSVFIGLNILWFIIWYSLSNVLSTILIGKRNIIKEMEQDNISYFLIRGVILVGVIISFLILYESILRVFLPNIKVPFYY